MFFLFGIIIYCIFVQQTFKNKSMNKKQKLELTQQEWEQVEKALNIYLRCQALLEYDNKHYKKVEELRGKVMVEIWNNK